MQLFFTVDPDSLLSSSLNLSSSCLKFQSLNRIVLIGPCIHKSMQMKLVEDDDDMTRHSYMIKCELLM